MKKIVCGIIFVLLVGSGFSQEPTQASIYQKCLEYREKNSDEFTKVRNEALIAENMYKQQLLSSFLVVDLGTGTMNFDFYEEGVDYSLSPNAKVSMPSLSNLNFGVSVPVTKKYDGSSSSGVNFNMGVDIFSSAISAQRLQRKTALDAKNAASEKLNFSKQIIEAEFLADCKEIMDLYLAYLSKQLENVSADIEFRRVRLEGYATSSVRFKAAELKANASKRQAETNEKIFLKSVEKFFKSCGLENEFNLKEKNFLETLEKFFVALSKTIPEEKILDTASLSLENSKQFLKAKQNYETTLEHRKIQNSSFTLSATSGFSFMENKITEPTKTSAKTKSLSGGLNFQFPGGSLFSGVTLNLDKLKNPSLNLAITFNPLEIYYKTLNDKNAKLQNELDALAFKSETEKCETQLSDMQANAESLGLLSEAANYEYKIYEQNAADIQRLFANGYTNKLENSQAHLEYLQALIKYGQTKANIINFNIQLIQSFNIETNINDINAKTAGEN